MPSPGVDLLPMRGIRRVCLREPAVTRRPVRGRGCPTPEQAQRILDAISGRPPIQGLDADHVQMLRDAWPCNEGRHTFDAGARVCLCGALGVGVSQEHPHAVLYYPVAR